MQQGEKSRGKAKKRLQTLLIPSSTAPNPTRVPAGILQVCTAWQALAALQRQVCREHPLKQPETAKKLLSLSYAAWKSPAGTGGDTSLGLEHLKRDPSSSHFFWVQMQWNLGSPKSLCGAPQGQSELSDPRMNLCLPHIPVWILGVVGGFGGEHALCCHAQQWFLPNLLF